MNFYMYSQNDSDSKAVGLYKIEIATEEMVSEDNLYGIIQKKVYFL